MLECSKEFTIYHIFSSELMDNVMGTHKRALPEVLEHANRELESVGLLHTYTQHTFFGENFSLFFFTLCKLSADA